MCQATRAWYTVLNRVLQGFGYLPLVSDIAVWRSTSLGFVATLVDDMLYSALRSSVNKIKVYLGKQFNFWDLGPTIVFIGLHIIRDREHRLIYIDQSHYSRDILDLHGMADCNPCLVPIVPSDQHLEKAREGECIFDCKKRCFQSIVGSLKYLMNYN